MLQEQAEAQGVRPRRMWELFSDRSVRFQVISVAIISSAMQLCGNDSVSMHTHGEVHSVILIPYAYYLSSGMIIRHSV